MAGGTRGVRDVDLVDYPAVAIVPRAEMMRCLAELADRQAARLRARFPQSVFTAEQRAELHQDWVPAKRRKRRARV
jgi:hypothetical protein